MKKKLYRKRAARTEALARRPSQATRLTRDPGRDIAAPQAMPATNPLQPIFTGRDWTNLPKIKFDSTLIISEERDAR